MTDVVLFDLDGTLTDSQPGIVNCLKYALDAFGIEHPDDATIRTFLGPPLMVTFREHFGMSDAEAVLALAKYRERYNDVGLFENDVYPGVREMLDRLANAENPPIMAISTSKPTGASTRILEHFDLAKYFAFIGGASLDASRDSKALVIEHTLDALGIDITLDETRQRTDDGPAITMVGDREHDVKGALAHGIPTIGVLWGYGSELELNKAGAIMTVPNPNLLGRVLLQS